MSENKGCNTGCGCSSKASQTKTEKRQIEIEFLYLDLNVCSPCKRAESSLDEALSEVSGVLRATGVEVVLKKTQIESMKQAVELGFLTSPTIRIDAKDLQLDFKENHCASCSALSGTSVDCRIWIYQGSEYQSPPKAMIIEAVLQEVYGNPRAEPAKIVRPENALENLTRFFESKGRKAFSGAV